jgi:hypothetical protein
MIISNRHNNLILFKNKLMNVLRKSFSRVIVVIFIGVCLSTSFANTTRADYFPRFLKKSLSTYGRTINATQLFLNSKSYPQDIHKDCIANQASKTKKIISTWIDLEDEDNLSFFSDSHEEKGSSHKQSNSNFQATIPVPKLSPIFLLKSSFRL